MAGGGGSVHTLLDRAQYLEFRAYLSGFGFKLFRLLCMAMLGPARNANLDQQTLPRCEEPRVTNEPVLKAMTAPSAAPTRDEMRASIQRKVAASSGTSTSDVTHDTLQESLKALSLQQSLFQSEVLAPAQRIRDGAQGTLNGSEAELKNAGFLDWVSGHTGALENAVNVHQKHATNTSGHADKLKNRHDGSLESKQAAEQLLNTAQRVESQGFPQEAAAMRSKAMALVNQASESLKGLSFIDPEQTAQTIAGLRKLNERLDGVIRRAEYASTAASVVKETAHVAAVGVGFGIGGPAGGALVNQGMRMIESTAEEGMHVALGNKTKQEAGKAFLQRSQDALVESGITAVSGLAGQRVGAIAQKLKGPVLAKAVDIISSGTIQSAGTGVQLGYEFTKAHQEFEKKNLNLSGPERDTAYSEFMNSRGFALDEVCKRLGASFAAGAGAKAVFHGVSKGAIASLPSRASVVPPSVEGGRHIVANAAENMTSTVGEVAANGQPISLETIVPALVGGHLSQVGVQSSSPTTAPVSPLTFPSRVSATDTIPSTDPRPRSEPAHMDPPNRKGTEDVRISKDVGPDIDYSLPDSAHRILHDPKITTRNAVVIVHHEGHFLYGLRRQGLDEAGTWSLISGGMEANDAHPIDAALRELSEETAYTGEFKSIKVLGGKVDHLDPTTAAVYVLAEAQERFTPSAAAETPEHIEWRWAPSTDCPSPAHPKMEQTQEIYFEALPVEQVVPAHGRLAAVHGTASWFPEFVLDKVVNGKIYGEGVYCGLKTAQGPDYARRAQLAQSPLHGQYVYKLDISTSIPGGGYLGVVKPASEQLVERTLTMLRAKGGPECERLADNLFQQRTDGKTPTAEALAGLFAQAAGTSYGDALETLGIKGKWVPGFCYVAFDPAHVTISERETLKPPAAPAQVLTYADTEMKQTFERSFEEVKDLRAALAWATDGTVGVNTGQIRTSFRDARHADDVSKAALGRYREQLMKAARAYGLDKVEERYRALHEEQLNDIRAALGSPDIQRMWAEQFPEALPGKLSQLFLDNWESLQDPEVFLQHAVDIVKPPRCEGWELAREGNSWFAKNYAETLQLIWAKLPDYEGTYPRNTPGELQESARQAERGKELLEDVAQPRTNFNNDRAFRQAIDVLITASAKVTEQRSLQDCLVDEALSNSRRRIGWALSTRLALQISECLRPGSGVTELPAAPSFLPKSGSVGRFFEKQHINRWLKTNDLSIKDISAAAPKINKLLTARRSELAEAQASFSAAAQEAQLRYDGFIHGTAKFREFERSFHQRRDERDSEFSKAVFELGEGSPLCVKAAFETELPWGRSLSKVGNILHSWKFCDKTKVLPAEHNLESAVTYFQQSVPSERAIHYAHDHRIMHRDYLHPSWTDELLKDLNSRHESVQVDSVSLQEAARLFKREME
jgi:8-oxo-dGTP pyrophosphatase MutT (NUDIX family)